jgi:hypothetical protein
MLIFPPFALLTTPALNNVANAPTTDNKILETTKEEEITETRLIVETPLTREELKKVLQDFAIEYGLNFEKMEATISCESGFQIDPPGNLVSRGVAQFTLDTWLAYCSDTDERLNPQKSFECMGAMWKKGLAYKWDCYCFTYYDESCVKLRSLYPIDNYVNE